MGQRKPGRLTRFSCWLTPRIRPAPRAPSAQVIGRGLRFAARREKRPLVGFQQVNPSGDVARTAHVAVKTEFRAKEGGAKFGNQFFGRVFA